MATKFHPAKLESLIIEDDKRDRIQIVEKLNSAQIFNLRVFDSYNAAQVHSSESRPEIISLDAEAVRSHISSSEIYSRLRKANPERTIVFFTSQPGAVIAQPVNFVLEKKPDVWNAYDQLLMMIMVHERILDVLGIITGIATPKVVVDKERASAALKVKIAPIISSVLSIREYFTDIDDAATERYNELEKLLTDIYANQSAAYSGHALKPLMSAALRELDEILQVEGAIATPQLERKLETLNKRVLERSDHRNVVMTAVKRAIQQTPSRIFDMLKLWDVPLVSPLPLIRVNQHVETEDEIEEVETDEGEDEFDDVDVGDDVPLNETDGKTAAKQDHRPIYLNAWFPKEDPAALKVDKRTVLRVNLAHEMVAATGSKSTTVPAEKSQLFYATNYVDVMAVSTNALIEPFVQRLDMPPDPERFVSFYFTPLVEGQIKYTIVLLIRNEPIFRASHFCTATVVESRRLRGGAA